MARKLASVPLLFNENTNQEFCKIVVITFVNNSSVFITHTSQMSRSCQDTLVSEKRELEGSSQKAYTDGIHTLGSTNGRVHSNNK